LTTSSGSSANNPKSCTVDEAKRVSISRKHCTQAQKPVIYIQ
jgi:hypothetical protein